MDCLPPPLPDLSGIDRDENPSTAVCYDLQGPNGNCSWIIPGRILGGRYPSEDELGGLVRGGVRVFVSLVGEEEGAHYGEVLWRYLAGTDFEMRHYGIPDFDVPYDLLSFSSFLDDLITESENGRMVYIHCVGGRGRTGMAAAYIIGKVYQLPPELALLHAQVAYNSRAYGHCNPSPESEEQREAVRQMLG